MKGLSIKGVFLTIFTFIFIATGFTQSSNKGKDFWVGFMNHRNGSQVGLYLYVTSDSSTTVTVEVPGKNWSTTKNVTANQMTLVSIPNNIGHVMESDQVVDRGVHITAPKNIVVYAHMYRTYRSDATLVLPTKTVGQKYYAIGYDQWRNGSGGNNDRSQFMIVANKDNTKVNITPTVQLYKNGGGSRAAGTTYQVTLDEGEVYQGRALNRNTTDDISGTLIEVIDTGATAGCRTVAVFSGSSDTRLGSCTAGWGTTSSDNLYQQNYPIRSWGTTFITVPFKNRKHDDIRILAANDNTQVVIYHIIGAPTVEDLDAGEYYTMKDVDEVKYIRADDQIMVAQYQQTRRCAGNTIGDPSMTILNPIEQTLEDITLYSSQYEDIVDHYINVIIPEDAASSFRIDGNSVSFSNVSRNPSYKYAQITTTKGNHRLTADKGFIAIAYGFGGYESYGYSAGANIKDLTATIELANSVLSSKGEDAICLGQSADFKGNAEYDVKNWIWDFGDGDTSHSQNVKHVYKDTGSYTVKLYTFKKSFDGCSNFDSAVLLIDVYGVPEAKVSTTSLCEKTTITFRDSTIAPFGENILFTQFTFDGTTNVYSKVATKTYDTTGKYGFRMIVATNHQCRDTIQDSLIVNPLPMVSFNFDNACFFDTTRFINTTTLTSGSAANNKWLFGDGDSATTFNANHYYNGTGEYIVKLETTSDSGCFGSFQDTVYKYEAYTIDFDYQDTCLGLEVDFTNNGVTSGKTIDGFIWRFPSTTYDTKDVSHTFANPGTYQITLVATIDSLCTDSMTHAVTVYPPVSADFKVSGQCFADTLKFIDLSTVATGSIDGLKWDFDDGQTAVDQDSVVIVYSSDGDQDVSLIAFSDKGCSDTISQTLTFYDPKITGIIYPDFCRSVTGNITATYQMGIDAIDTYDWAVNGTSMSTDDNLDYPANTLGKFEIKLTVKTDNGCEIVEIDSFVVNDRPQASFFVNDVCDGDDFAPSNSSFLTVGTITENKWFIDDVFNIESLNPTFPGQAVGTYKFTLVTNTDKGCTDTLSLNAKVNPNPVVDFVISDTCEGLSSKFEDISTITSGSNDVIQWTFDDASNASGSQVSYVNPGPGVYNIQLDVTSDAGCSGMKSRTYTVEATPVIDMTLDATEGCAPTDITIIDNSSVANGTIDQFDIDWNDGNNSNNLTHTYTDAGSYNIGVKATSNAGCIDSIGLTETVLILPIPTANFTFTPDDPSILNPIVTFNNSSSIDATTWDWGFSTGEYYTGSSITHTFLDSGLIAVTLTVENANGCSDEITKIVKVSADLFIHIPTGFSPNDDGLNDEFGLGGLVVGIDQFYMRIFNSYGSKVFETKDPKNKWDGDVNGSKAQEGVYVYEIGMKDNATKQWRFMNGVLHVHR